MYYGASVTSSFNLQTTLAASSSGVGDPPPGPHHPLSCQSTLELGEDNSLACEHTQVPAGDARTQACVDHSIAILLIEVLRERENADAG